MWRAAGETDPCIMTGVPSLLCDSCYQQLGHLQEQNQQAELGKTENMVAGTVGALLGSLLALMGVIAGLVGIVWFLVALWRSRRNYEALPPLGGVAMD